MDASRAQLEAAIARAQADGNDAAVQELTAALGQVGPDAPPPSAQETVPAVEPSRMQLVEAYMRAQKDGNDAAVQELLGAIKAQEANGPAPEQPEPIADRFAKVIPALKTMAGGITPWADEGMAAATSALTGRPYDQELARHRADMSSLPERDRNALQYTGMGVGMVGGAKALSSIAGAAPGLLKLGGIPYGIAAGGLQMAGAGETPQERVGLGIVGAGLGGLTAGIASAATPLADALSRRVSRALGSNNPFNAAGGRGAERVFREAAKANPDMVVSPAELPVRNKGLSAVSNEVVRRGGPNAAKIIEAGNALRAEAADVAGNAANSASIPGVRTVSEAERAANAADAYYAAGLPQSGKPPITTPVFDTASNDLGDALKQPNIRRIIRDLPGSMKNLPDGNMEKLHAIAKAARFRADAATDPLQSAALSEERSALLSAIEKRNPAYGAAVKEYGNDTRLMNAFTSGYNFDKASAPTSYKIGKMGNQEKGAFVSGLQSRVRDVVATSSSPGAAAKALGVRKSVDMKEVFKDNPDVLKIITSQLRRAEELDRLGKALAPDSVLAARAEQSMDPFVANPASANLMGSGLRTAGQTAAHVGQLLKFGKKTNRVVGNVLTDPKAAPYLAALLEKPRRPMAARGTAIGAGMQAMDILQQLRERYARDSGLR